MEHMMRRGSYMMCALGIGLFVLVLGYAAPSHAQELEVALEPTERVYVPGDVFVMPVRVRGVTECVNAFSLEVGYDTEYLTAVDVARGLSIMTLWTESPTIDQEQGTITFTGGVPGGYCGRLQGDPGLTNILTEIVFSVRSVSERENVRVPISISRATVHAHDGVGTLLPVTSRSATIEISPTIDLAPTNEWIERGRGDSTAPALFDVILHSDPAVADGRYYIVFSTTDKESGISHFEVLETDPRQWGFLTWVTRESGWIPVESNIYVLRDQSLRSAIQVKAVDKAGNERIVTYQPPEHLRSMFHWTDGIAVIVVVLLIAGAAYLIRRRQDNSKV